MNELEAVRKVGETMDENRLRDLLAKGGLAGKVAAGLLPRLQELTKAALLKADCSLEAKFAEGARFQLQYSGLSNFFGGLEKRIGAPDPNVAEAVEKEHVHEADSQDYFTTSNYQITTTPETEYYFVVAPERLREWPCEKAPGRSCRQTLPLVELEKRLALQNQKLSELNEPHLTVIEAIGGRLYTGPM